MSLRLLTAADFRSLPWQNGRGTTLELVRRDDGAGALLWRLSVADVVEPGPFSPLPGIDRVITLIDGAGFDLDFDGEGPPVSLKPFEPLVFSGDWPTVATAVHGPSRDFNVMTARGRIAAEVELARDGLVTAGFTYIFAASGGVAAVAGGVTVRAEAGDLIECRTEHKVHLMTDPAGTALIVHLRSANGQAIL